MSMNLVIAADGYVTTPNGKLLPFIKYFDCWETPTEVTNAIIALEDKEEMVVAYKEWVDRNHEDSILIDTSEDEDADEFSEYCSEGGYDVKKEHIADLDEFIKMYEDYGLTIKFYSI